MNNLSAGSLLDPLKERENDILRLIADGLTNREIAQELFIAVETVKWYNKQIYSKLDVSSRTQAAARARELGLLDEQRDAPVESKARPRHNLPVQITSFVGRAHETAEVTHLLRESHLLTLTGPGGTGKTRLALQVADGLLDAFEHGVFFVDLAPIGQPELVAGAIAAVLGLKVAAGEPTAEALKGYLSGRQTLLLLDNFEHLIEAAPLAGDLLSVAPDLKILATSREALRVYGEQEYAVPPLGVPDPGRREPLPPSTLSEYGAVALYIQRAQAVRPDFTLTGENAPAVAEICVRLDGLPLALELAAGRAKLFSPQALLGQLESRFTALRGGPRDLPARQRTLRGAIEWSYDLLDEAEKTLFTRLSVFQGGCTIEAVQAVCCHELPVDVLDGLASLLNKNLLRQEDGPEGEPRFVMLETIRQYGRETLDRLGETGDLRRRHAETFTALAERADPYTRGGPDQMRWLRRLEADHDNLRAALAWALDGEDIELGMRLAGALGYFWVRQSHHAEGQRWASRALEADANGAAPPSVRAGALFTAGLMATYLHDSATARRSGREALALYRELEDRRNAGWTLIWLAVYYNFAGPDEYREGLDLCEEGLLLLREVNDRQGIAQGLNILGELTRLHQDYERAREAYEECLILAREMGDRMREAMLVGNLGYLAKYQGDLERARELYRQALSVSLDIDDDQNIAWALVSLGGAANDLGQPERGARLLGAAGALMDAKGFRPQISDLPDYERAEAAIREQLGAEAFEAAQARGRAMSLEEAVADALDEPDPA
jgi:predicted ATPase/DNA-binding CsgD family transcriptional regulator